MKKIATWLASGMIVAAAAACSVTVDSGDGGTSSTGGTGGTGATGGTGGAGGTAGTGGSSGSGGTAGATDGGAGTAGGDSGGTMCVSNPNTDPRCNTCAFNRCQMDHCACNAITSCRTPMLAFYMCLSMPNADEVACTTTFITNANPDAMGGGLASDVATCVVDDCFNTCQGRDASTRNRSLKESLEALRSGDQR